MRIFISREQVTTGLSLAFASFVITACASDTSLSSDAGPLTISFTTRSAAAASVSAQSSTRNAVLASDSVLLTKAQLVLREIELERVTGPDCSGSDSGRTALMLDRGHDSTSRSGRSDDRANDADDDDCLDIELGPVLIDLPLNDQVRSQLQAPIPAGEFREIELRVDRPENGDSASRAFIARNPLFEEFSVLAEGTFGGRPFRFLGRVRTRLEFEFRPSLTVGVSGANITVRVQVRKWFRTPDGKAIDPATAMDGGVNTALVIRNIAASIQAFADGDRDGDERS